MFIFISIFLYDFGDFGNVVGWEEVLRYKYIE